MNSPPETPLLFYNQTVILLENANDLVGKVVVTMEVCFGQALLSSEAKLPVSRAWIFSCQRDSR